MDLTLQEASNPGSIVILGALVVKQLQVSGKCTFFINTKGVIELANPVEPGLDLLPEEQAIKLLVINLRYTDEQLVAYLRGRDARLSSRGEGWEHP